LTTAKDSTLLLISGFGKDSIQALPRSEPCKWALILEVMDVLRLYPIEEDKPGDPSSQANLFATRTADAGALAFGLTGNIQTIDNSSGYPVSRMRLRMWPNCKSWTAADGCPPICQLVSTALPSTGNRTSRAGYGSAFSRWWFHKALARMP